MWTAVCTPWIKPGARSSSQVYSTAISAGLLWPPLSPLESFLMTIEATTTDGLWMENITYDELAVGHSARLVRTVTLQDIQAFAAVSGVSTPPT